MMKQFRWKLLLGLSLLLGVSGAALTPLVLVPSAYAASRAPARPASPLNCPEPITTSISPQQGDALYGNNTLWAATYNLAGGGNGGTGPYSNASANAWVGFSCNNYPVTLVYQTDSNLVLYLGGYPAWFASSPYTDCAGSVSFGYNYAQWPFPNLEELGMVSCHKAPLLSIAQPEGMPNPQNGHLDVQSDGNVVIYGDSGISDPVWNTGTNNVANGGPVHYCVSETAETVTINPGTALYPGEAWVGLISCNIPVVLWYQEDGNLVLYIDGLAKWSTGTGGICMGTKTRAVFQTDGNLVVYDCNGTASWAESWFNSNWAAGQTLKVQGDGNIVSYDSSGHPIWASNTYCGTCVY